MKNLYPLAFALVTVLFFGAKTNYQAQGCLNTFEFGSFDASTLGAEVEMIDNCNFFGDYSVISNIAGGSDLRITVSNDGFLTVREGSFDGPVLASADSALTIFDASGDDLFVHWNSNVSCGTLDGECVETFIQCLNCDGCVSTSQFISFDLTGTEPELFELTDCNWRGEYNEILGVPVGETLEFTASTGYMTVREGTTDGPIVGEGFSSVVVNTTGADLYVHYSSDENCTANDLVECITSTVQCTSCLFSNPNDGDCFFPGEFGSVDIDPGNSESIQISTCNFQAEHSEVNGTLGRNIEFTTNQQSYITVRGGTPNGPVVIEGFVNAGLNVFDAQFDQLYVHWSVNQNCDTDFSCIQTFVTCLSCATCPDGIAGEPCDDGDPNTFGTTIQSDCSCGGGFFGPTNDICSGVMETLNCGEEIVGNTDTANVPEFTPSGCGSGISGGSDLWYSFEASGTEDYQLRLRAGPTAAFWVGNFYVYSGECGDLNEIACSEPFTSNEDNIELNNLPAGTYYIQVFSQSALENSFFLRLTCSQACNNPFPAVTESSLVTLTSPTSIVTEWSPVPNQIGCQIQVRFAGGSILGAQIVGGANADGFNIPLSALQPGTDYEWRVRCGCSQTPLVAGPFTSWQPFSTFAGISVVSSPNPTQGLSNVTFSSAQPDRVTLEVYDMNGRLVDAIYNGNVLADQEYRVEFDGGYLPNGIYIYRLTTTNEVVNERFMIAK